MNEPSRRLVVFTKYPDPGRVKTRMIPRLGADGAAELQRAMTGHTILHARAWAAANGGDVEVYYDGGSRRRFRRWLGAELRFVPQGPGDLGARMNRAIRDAGRVVVIGCDCPGLDARVIEKAFASLKDHDVILGPASDGGYYLIGLRAPAPQLFDDIAWGGDTVSRSTLEKAGLAGLKPAVLETLDDVDRPDDLHVWERTEPRTADAPAISVIIPALNEESRIGACIESAQPGALEVIVADGGSTDRTRELAGKHGASVIRAPRGRASQMNAAALAARGNVLLFLHADTRLPPAYADAVAATLSGPVAAGAFRLRIEGRGIALRAVEWGANVRTRALGLPYGDQAIFMRRATFMSYGGFENIPILEDVRLVRRLRARENIHVRRECVVTSGRRWTEKGVAHTTIANQLILLGDRLRVSPRRLAHLNSASSR